jgi:MFS transporter, DHA1 family, multidrug resistance protein
MSNSQITLLFSSLALIITSSYYSLTLFLPVIPTFIQIFNASEIQGLYTTSFWFLGSLVSHIPAAIFCSRFGTSRIIFASTVFFIIINVAIVYVVTVNQFIFIRFVQGCCLSFLLIPGLQIATNSLKNQKTYLLFLNFIAIISVLSPIIGPMLGAFIYLNFGWYAMFILISIICTLNLPILYLYLNKYELKEKKDVVSFTEIANTIKNINFSYFTVILSIFFGLQAVWITSSPLLLIEANQYSLYSYGVLQAMTGGAFIFGLIVSFLIFKDNNLYPNFLISGIILLLATVFYFIFNNFTDEIVLLLIMVFFMNLAAGISFSVMQAYILRNKNLNPLYSIAILNEYFGLSAFLFSFLTSLIYNGTVNSLMVLIIPLSIISSILLFFSKKMLCYSQLNDHLD